MRLSILAIASVLQLLTLWNIESKITRLLEMTESPSGNTTLTQNANP